MPIVAFSRANQLTTAVCCCLKVEVRFAAQGANRSVEVSQAVLNMSSGSNKEPNPPVVVEHERCVYPHVEKCAPVCHFV